MAAPGGEVVLCVGISHSKSVVTVQRAFRAQYAKGPPTDETFSFPVAVNNFIKVGPL